MATTEMQNRTPTAVESSVTELSSRVSEQVSEILEEVKQRQPIRPSVAYRIPSPGVRYYF